MTARIKYSTFLTVVVLSVLPTSVWSQDQISKEIMVVKPYQPSLSDAFKINVLPMVSDSISIRPSFDYSIQPKKFETQFQVRPITPATLVGTPLTKLYKSYLKLGFGNYLVPLGELHVNSLRDKDKEWGIAMRHYSINGKLKLDNDKKVNPGYFENSGSFYGKKIFQKSYFSGKFNAAYDGGNFYGYHPSLDTLFQKDDIRQTYLKMGESLQMGSIHKDSLHLNYVGTLGYFYTKDYYKNYEHAIVLNTDWNERFRSGHTYGLGIGGAYYITGESIDSLNNLVINLNPWMGKTTGEYTYRIGFTMAIDAHGEDLKAHFYPDLLLQINLVEGILMPYFGAHGRLQTNNFRSVAEENRYIVPGLKVENTNHKIRGFAGLKGSFSKMISYDMNASYSLVSRMPFYINDTLSPAGNTFSVVYDDVEWIQIKGELRYRQTERLNMLLSVVYDHYKMEALEKPWHKPNLFVSLDGQYSLHKKILVGLGAYYMGERFAPATVLDTEVNSFKGFVDLNIGLEYRYTKILSGFVHFNNILGSRNYIWNQYPAMGFNVMFGFTYAL